MWKAKWVKYNVENYSDLKREEILTKPKLPQYTQSSFFCYPWSSKTTPFSGPSL